MEKILKMLPDQKKNGLYIADLGNSSGVTGSDYSFFDRILRFSYRFDIPYREGPLTISTYNIALNVDTKEITIGEASYGAGVFFTSGNLNE